MDSQEKQSKETKKSKKMPIIIACLILIILIGSIGGYLGYKHFEENKSVGSSWGDTYFTYLKEASNEKNSENKENYGFKNDMKNTKLQFIDLEEENPIMLISYESENKNYVNVYKINEENQVDKIVYTEPAKIELLYNIQNKEYNWYLHQEKENKNSYIEIKKILENPEIKEPSYTIITDEKTTQEKLSGETITLSKLDETFIKPEIEAILDIDFSLDTDLKTIKEQLEKLVKEYQELSDLITEQVKNEVDKRVTDVENTKKEIEDAKAEIKAEEERKAAEEAAKKEAEEKAKAEEAAKKATSTTISEEQAQKLAQKIYGTKDPDTGFPIGATVECKVKDSSGKQYYLMRVRWLVDNSHWSTIDGIAIALDGKSWKKIDIYDNYTEGSTIKQVYSSGTF